MYRYSGSCQLPRPRAGSSRVSPLGSVRTGPGSQDLSHHPSQKQGSRGGTGATPVPGIGHLPGVRERPGHGSLGRSGSMGPMAGQGRAVGSWRAALLRRRWGRG